MKLGKELLENNRLNNWEYFTFPPVRGERPHSIWAAGQGPRRILPE